MKSVGLYFSVCFATDSCYCNISYATVIPYDFKKISIPDILLLNLTISLQGERNAQVNYKLLTTMAKKSWLLFEEKKNLKSLQENGLKIINDCVDTKDMSKLLKKINKLICLMNGFIVVFSMHQVLANSKAYVRIQNKKRNKCST